MAKYNRIVTDSGKGRQMLRRSKGHVVLANGTVYAVVDQIPVPFRIRRVLYGSGVATDITGVAELKVLAKGSDLDTAAGAGNRVITNIADFTTKKLLDSDDIAAGSPGALTALGRTLLPAESVLVMSVAHNGPVVGGDVFCVVEWDAVGVAGGAYTSGEEVAGTYEA